MEYLKSYRIFESIDKLLIKKSVSDDVIFYKLKLGKNIIGHADISRDISDIFKKVRNGEIVLGKNEMYLDLIEIDKKYIGKRFGTFLLKYIFDDLNLSSLYLFSANNPRWDEIATVVDTRRRKSYIYKDKMVDDKLYKITKKQILSLTN